MHDEASSWMARQGDASTGNMRSSRQAGTSGHFGWAVKNAFSDSAQRPRTMRVSSTAILASGMRAEFAARAAALKILSTCQGASV